MIACLNKASLSPARRQLVERLQRINFGRLEELVIRNQEPVLDPPPKVIREVKFGGDNGPRSELKDADFLLKSQVVELLDAIDGINNGVIELLEIKHGLPFRMLVRESTV
jgi:hypothetical protein